MSFTSKLAMLFIELALYTFMALAGALVASGIGLQTLRERLVQHLILDHSPLALEVSDWAIKGAMPGGSGYWNGIKNEYLWGEKAKVFIENPATRSIILWARALRVLRSVAWLETIAVGVLYLILLRFAQ